MTEYLTYLIKLYSNQEQKPEMKLNLFQQKIKYQRELEHQKKLFELWNSGHVKECPEIRIISCNPDNELPDIKINPDNELPYVPENLPSSLTTLNLYYKEDEEHNDMINYVMK
jgi:hypothetical protein